MDGIAMRMKRLYHFSATGEKNLLVESGLDGYGDSVILTAILMAASMLFSEARPVPARS